MEKLVNKNLQTPKKTDDRIKRQRELRIIPVFSMDFDDESVLSGVLLPLQFYSGAFPTPYHRLLGAILEDAIRCFQKNCGARSIRRHRIFQEAEEWLFDGRGTGFTSSVTVCESLGIDPNQLRRYLRKWKLNKQAELSVRPLELISLTPADPDNCLHSQSPT